MAIKSENGREFREVSIPLDVCSKLEAIAELIDMNPWREDKVIEYLINRFSNKDTGMTDREYQDLMHENKKLL